MHPGQEVLQAMIEEAGFEGCTYSNLTGGIVALHTAYNIKRRTHDDSRILSSPLGESNPKSTALDADLLVKLPHYVIKLLNRHQSFANAFLHGFGDTTLQLHKDYSIPPDTIIHSTPLGLIRLSLHPPLKFGRFLITKLKLQVTHRWVKK